jgi:heme-degrading monooxygenase HmoA
MIIRIVKLNIQPDKTAEFLTLFNDSKSFILNSEGCSFVQVLTDIKQPNLFFTYSCWDTEEHLNKYRDSEVFEGIWKRTKLLFADKAEAWSLISPIE